MPAGGPHELRDSGTLWAPSSPGPVGRLTAGMLKIQYGEAQTEPGAEERHRTGVQHGGRVVHFENSYHCYQHYR